MTSIQSVQAGFSGVTFAVEASALVVVAWIGTRFCRRRAAVSHAIWVAAYLAIAALPLFMALHAPAKPMTVEVPLAAATGARAAANGSASRLPLMVEIGLSFWLLGSALGLAFLGSAALGLGRIVRRSYRVDGLDDEVRELSERVGLRRRVELRATEDDQPWSAMTWGTLSPIVLLPCGFQVWTPAERRAILLHELAHVKRRDSLWQVLAAVATIGCWFNPLMWVAAVAFKADGERAADDAVIHAGVSATDYALTLVAVASRAGRHDRLQFSLGVKMMKGTKFEERIKAIINPHRIRTGLTVVQIAGMAITALTVSLLAINLRPILAIAPDVREGEFDQALFMATQHMRDAHTPLRKAGAKRSEGGPEVNVSASDAAEAAKKREAEAREVRAAADKERSRIEAARPLHAALEPTAPIAMQVEPVARQPLQAPVKLVANAEPPQLNEDRDPIDVDENTTVAKPAAACTVQRLPEFHAVKVDSNIQVSMNVEARSGCSVDVGVPHPGDPNFFVDSGVLHITGGGNSRVTITTNRLDSLDVEAGSAVICRGISGQSFDLHESGGSSVRLVGRSTELKLNVSGGSSLQADVGAWTVSGAIDGGSSARLAGSYGQMGLEINGGSSVAASGNTRTLELSGNNGSSIDLSQLVSQRVQASANEHSSMKLNVKAALTAHASRAGTISYLGRPRSLLVDRDESSRIQPE